MHRIAIFASGSGTNAERIAEYFSGSAEVSVALVLTNHPQAGVIARAARLGIPAVVFGRGDFSMEGEVGEALRRFRIDFLVLAGFLWLVPADMLAAYPGRILNIHPALLPKYGGRGMYGMRVHEAVIAAGESESGITIHYVNDRYDEGATVFQARCPVGPGDTPESLANRVHALEYLHYPEVIHGVIKNQECGEKNRVTL